MRWPVSSTVAGVRRGHPTHASRRRPSSPVVRRRRRRRRHRGSVEHARHRPAMRRHPEEQPEVGEIAGQAEAWGARPGQQAAATSSDGVQRGRGRAPHRGRRRRHEVLLGRRAIAGSSGGGGSGSGARPGGLGRRGRAGRRPPASTGGRSARPRRRPTMPRPLGVLVEIGPQAAALAVRRATARPGGRRPGDRLVPAGIGVLPHLLLDDRAGLAAAGAVDEQPVRRRAGEVDGPRVGRDGGRGLQVGGDPGSAKHVEQVLADPRVDVAHRAPQRGVQPVVAPAPAPPRRSPRLRRGDCSRRRNLAPGGARRGSRRRSRSKISRGVVVERGHVVAVGEHDLGRVGARDAGEQQRAADRLDDVVLGAAEDQHRRGDPAGRRGWPPTARAATSCAPGQGSSG